MSNVKLEKGVAEKVIMSML